MDPLSRTALKLLRVYLTAVVVVLNASAQRRASEPVVWPPQMSLEDASRRESVDFVPAHAGKIVTLEGVVAGNSVHLHEYSHQVIQSANGTGFTLESDPDYLRRLKPGDLIRVAGMISDRAGLPVLLPARLSILSHQAPVAPQPMRVSELAKFRNTGRYISVEGKVLQKGENSGGDVVVIGDDEQRSIAVFWPRLLRSTATGLRSFTNGDRLRVVGISSQYCLMRPYDCGFQVLVGDMASVQLLARGWALPPHIFAYSLSLLTIALVLWWLRERHMGEQKRTMREMISLSEEVLAAPTREEIAHKIQTALPPLLKASLVDLYVYNANLHTLNRMAGDGLSEPIAVSIDSPIGPFSAAVALCFRNRTLLDIPDTRTSPFLNSKADAKLPRAALLVPLFAGAELLGVLAVQYQKRAHRPTTDQQTALQHLSNQIGASLRLQEQQSMREQLLRSEKMAAAGQLISDVATEMVAPLTHIERLAGKAITQQHFPATELEQIAVEARRGVLMVNHLVSFARMERSEPETIDILALVNSLVELRAPECALKGLQLKSTLPVSPLFILASRGQIEQMLLSLLVQCEHAAASSSEKWIAVSSRALGRRVQISIEYPGDSEFVEWDLKVSQAIAESQGGSVVRNALGNRYDIELALHQPEPVERVVSPPKRGQRTLTIALFEPDLASHRRVLTLLSVRNHRVIPVSDAEEAADIVQRFSFDALFCAAGSADSTWLDLFGRVRRKVDSFVLLTIGKSDELFREGEGFVLPKPVKEEDLEQLLTAMETRRSLPKR
jgi:signal transduction histidine kinase